TVEPPSPLPYTTLFRSRARALRSGLRRGPWQSGQVRSPGRLRVGQRLFWSRVAGLDAGSVKRVRWETGGLGHWGFGVLGRWSERSEEHTSELQSRSDLV